MSVNIRTPDSIRSVSCSTNSVRPMRDGWYAESVKAEDRPIALDEDQVLGASDTVQIEKNATLREIARQIVFRNAFR